MEQTVYEWELTVSMKVLSTIPKLKVDAFSLVLHKFESIESLAETKQVHTWLLINGFDQNPFLGTQLVSAYAKFGSVEDATIIFNRIINRNVFLCNAMIRGYANNGRCEDALAVYHQMQQSRMQPDKYTFPCVLKACAALSALGKGRELHECVIVNGFERDVFVGNALVSMYAKCGVMECARQVFDKMSHRNVVSWNSIIAGYAQNGHGVESLKFFQEMKLALVKPDSVTMALALSACASLRALEQGKEIHDYIIRNSLGSDVLVGNALVDMYAKCANMDVARIVYDKMSERNVASWNTIIGGYVQNGNASEALKLFRRMEGVSVKLDSVTIACVLSACGQLTIVQQGREIHGLLIKNGFDSVGFVENALLDMYAKCGQVELACQVFDKMPQRDAVSWNAMITGYIQNGHFDQALEIFREMRLARVMPNSVSIASVLPACTCLAALQQGKNIHNYILRRGFEADVFVMNALIDMYVKCGNIEDACQVFESISEKTVVSWNAMIAGYTLRGQYIKAFKLFCQMKLAGVKPNPVTIASVLSACGHAGALQQGNQAHAYLIISGFQSYFLMRNVLIDMYAKCGNIQNSHRMFDRMSERTVTSWNTLIAGYGMHGLGNAALALFHEMKYRGIKPDHITFVSVLSACSHAGLVNEGLKCFDYMIQYYHITPRVEHYACMVDLLGRAGRLDDAHNIISTMPVEPDASVWGALLGACRIHCNLDMGKHVAEHLFELEPENTGNYVLLANIYTAAGQWEHAAQIRTVMQDKGLKKRPGCSWIEVKNRVHIFIVGDQSHPASEKIYALLESLASHMEEAGYVPDTNFLLLNLE